MFSSTFSLLKVSKSKLGLENYIKVYFKYGTEFDCGFFPKRQFVLCNHNFIIFVSCCYTDYTLLTVFLF